jgi:hypothetical protein
VPVGPEGLDQVVAGSEPVTVENQVGEQESALASRQVAVETLSIPLDDGWPAELDSR